MQLYGPVFLSVEPPRHARVHYKAVAVIDGEARSIFDGETRYPIGQTVFHQAGEDHTGGLYCFRTVEECLARDDSMFPRGCALLNAPRAIARVLAWNLDTSPPVVYGTKRSFSCIRVLELLPMPLTWGLHLMGFEEGAGSDASVAPPSSAPSPSHAPSRWQALTSSRPPTAPRALVRRQAETLRLEWEVQQMEQRLLMARGLGMA